jgi:hypothetical protein
METQILGILSLVFKWNYCQACPDLLLKRGKGIRGLITDGQMARPSGGTMKKEETQKKDPRPLE